MQTEKYKYYFLVNFKCVVDNKLAILNLCSRNENTAYSVYSNMQLSVFEKS